MSVSLEERIDAVRVARDVDQVRTITEGQLEGTLGLGKPKDIVA